MGCRSLGDAGMKGSGDGSETGIDFLEIREAVRALCARFPATYFREVDQQGAYPGAFVRALTEAGWLAALIPQEFGGAGLGLSEASVIMEEINRCGGNAGA